MIYHDSITRLASVFAIDWLLSFDFTLCSPRLPLWRRRLHKKSYAHRR